MKIQWLALPMLAAIVVSGCAPPAAQNDMAEPEAGSGVGGGAPFEPEQEALSEPDLTEDSAKEEEVVAPAVDEKPEMKEPAATEEESSAPKEAKEEEEPETQAVGGA